MFLIRIWLSPIIVSVYTFYGARVGTKNGCGILRGAIAGWATGTNYVLSGSMLIPENENENALHN